MAKIPVNLSSVHHASFERLHDITSNYNQAMLLDKLMFWWQISTYTLDDGNIWFTRSVEQIAQESRLSVRTVGRYLKPFADAGYIEKCNRLHKKKNLYIRVANKLLLLVGAKPAQPKAGESTPFVTKEPSTPNTPCLFSEHVGQPVPPIWQFPYIKNKIVILQLTIQLVNLVALLLGITALKSITRL